MTLLLSSWEPQREQLIRLLKENNRIDGNSSFQGHISAYFVFYISIVFCLVDITLIDSYDDLT